MEPANGEISNAEMDEKSRMNVADAKTANIQCCYRYGLTD
jgi:hypothetical protein